MSLYDSPPGSARTEPMDASADEIEARLRGQTRRLVIAAAQLGSMKWVAEHLSARAVIAAGMGIKTRSAKRFNCCRRRRWPSARSTLTPAGASSMEDGPTCTAAAHSAPVARSPESETSLPAALAPFSLPASPTGAELRSAIRASLAVLNLAPDRVTGGADRGSGLAKHPRRR